MIGSLPSMKYFEKEGKNERIFHSFNESDNFSKIDLIYGNIMSKIDSLTI
jgi:hypothetical protein